MSHYVVGVIANCYDDVEYMLEPYDESLEFEKSCKYPNKQALQKYENEVEVLEFVRHTIIPKYYKVRDVMKG